MPRKSKITAVPLDKPEQEEGLARAWDQEAETDAKTDAEQMTEIIQEVKEVAEPAPVEEPVKEKAKKATPKAKAKAKAKAEVQVEEPVAEVKEEVKSEAKSEAKVACPDCGKQMSAKTLKYSHVPNCTAKKQQKRGKRAGRGKRGPRSPHPCGNHRERGAKETELQTRRTRRSQGRDGKQIDAERVLIFRRLGIYTSKWSI